MGVEIGRQVAAAPGDRVEREPADLAALAVQGAHFGRTQRTGQTLGVDRRAPEDFVGHPVADAGKPFLHEQHGLDRRPGPAAQEGCDRLLRELVRDDGGRDFRPPRRRRLPHVEEHAAKHAGIVEDELPLLLHEDEVVVLGSGVVRRLDAQLAAHAEVDTEPRVAAEMKEHLLRGRFRVEQGGAGQLLLQGRRARAAKNLFPLVQAHGEHLGPMPGAPAFAEKFNFGEFGHACFL